jgi:hypothetical protein
MAFGSVRQPDEMEFKMKAAYHGSCPLRSRLAAFGSGTCRSTVAKFLAVRVYAPPCENRTLVQADSTTKSGRMSEVRFVENGAILLRNATFENAANDPIRRLLRHEDGALIAIVPFGCTPLRSTCVPTAGR